MKGRPLRTGLLVGAVALAAMLAAALSVTLGSFEQSLVRATDQLVGQADLRIHHTAGNRIDDNLIERASRWPGVRQASARLEIPGVLARGPGQSHITPLTFRGLPIQRMLDMHRIELIQGTLPADDTQLLLDDHAAKLLDARVGDRITIEQPQGDVQLTVSGLYERHEIGLFPTQTIAIVPLTRTQEVSGYAGLVDRVELALEPNVDVEAFIQTHASDLPDGIAFQTPAEAKKNTRKLMGGMRLSFFAALLLVYMASAYIVLTSLTTMVSERTRELAAVRCIGASRTQIAAAQLVTGLLLATGGAAVGAPLGLAGGIAIWHTFAADLGQWHARPGDIITTILAATASGLLGALYPAYRAARVSPIQAMAARSRKPSAKAILACALVGFALVTIGPLLALAPVEAESFFWAYASVGMPATFIGYILLAAPLLAVGAPPLAALIGRIAAVPVPLLRGAVLAAPICNGMTAGGLMVGLMLLVATWTIGRSMMNEFLEDVKLPELYIYRLPVAFLNDGEIQVSEFQRLQQIEGVARACPTSRITPRLIDAKFGLAGYTPRETNFLTFNPDCFFAVAEVQWHEGDQQTATRKLKQGGAILVSREYSLVHNAHVGDNLTLDADPQPVTFEIAGVISNRGLDVAVQALSLNQEFSRAAVSFVFGSTEDGQRYFGADAYDMVLVKTTPGADVEAVRQRIIEQLRVNVVSAGRILGEVRRIAQTSLLMASVLAYASLAIACAGVGNMLATEIDARRFEFGVLRAIGGGSGMIGRFVLAQVMLVAIIGCVIGSAGGVQISLMRQVLMGRLMGVEYATIYPPDVIAIGWASVIGAAVLATAPALVHLLRQHPRQLLAARE